jgi:prepilin-type N-terminal cleavage/methylation domain-containing protein
MRKAFTLIELVVALGVLAIILSFASVIFRVSIDAQRLAMANAEIMQKFRVITQQLDADFSGRLAMYGAALSAHDTIEDANGVPIRSDSIGFFACGDFQTTNQYGGQTIVGNVAAIYYGPPDPCFYNAYYVGPPEPRQRLLLRRQKIFAPEVTVAPSGPVPVQEYRDTSLSQWWADPALDVNDMATRPQIPPTTVAAYQPLYLAEGVGDFAIHYLPSDADVGDLSTSWQRDVVGDPDEQGQAESIQEPRALRFTFTLYDSRGIIANGRRFTHIVPWSE